MKMIHRAATLSLLALTMQACAPSVGVAPMPSPSASTGTPNGGNPGGQPGEATPSPTVTATPVPFAPATLSGKVYDEKGGTVSGAKVTVKSMNPSSPFESTVDVANGSYVMNDIPAGVVVEVSVTKDGWTRRSQTTSLVPISINGNTLNFGGAGNAYFISDFPEIAAVSPTKDMAIDGAKLVYTLTLSEALDDTNKRRFENAVRLMPADAIANGGGNPTDLTADEDGGYPRDLTVEDAGHAPQLGAYAIANGTTFMNDADRRATVAWSADNLTATLTFDAPLLAGETADARYQVALMSNGDRIVDKSGKQLGTNAAGDMTAYPASGKLILGVFKPESLALKTIAGLTANSAAAMWASTHDDAAAFKVKEDDVAPQLTGVAVSKLSNATRIELTFSEPMAAFDGTADGFVRPTVLDLANYTFALGAAKDNLASVKLDGTAEATVDAGAVTTYGASGEREKEFKFTGGVTATVDAKDPKRVFLTIAQASFFNLDARDLKVRVENAADPAGNAIVTSGDASVKMGQL